MNEGGQIGEGQPGDDTGQQEWSQQPQQQQQQQQPPQQQQQFPQQQRVPQRMDTGGIGKKAIMAILMISMLLIAIGGVWLAFSGVPPYEAVDPDEDPEDRSDARDDYNEGMLLAQTFAGVITWLGLLIGAMISVYGALGDTELSEEEQKAMLIFAGFFVVGLVLFFNHYSYMIL